jgi:hypothetical protein
MYLRYRRYASVCIPSLTMARSTFLDYYLAPGMYCWQEYTKTLAPGGPGSQQTKG